MLSIITKQISLHQHTNSARMLVHPRLYIKHIQTYRATISISHYIILILFAEHILGTYYYFIVGNIQNRIMFNVNKSLI